MLEIEKVSAISAEMRAVGESEWPEPRAQAAARVVEWNCGNSWRIEVGLRQTCASHLELTGGIMKKRVKRTKAKSSSTRARTRSKPKRRKAAQATKKSVLPKVKRVAKKAALAAGVAAIGTALSELQPEIKSGERDASHENKSTRGKTSED
jgi:hypothetical protein